MDNPEKYRRGNQQWTIQRTLQHIQSTQDEEKQNKDTCNTIFVETQITQIRRKSSYKQQRGKYEQNIGVMWTSYRTSQPGTQNVKTHTRTATATIKMSITSNLHELKVFNGQFLTRFHRLNKLTYGETQQWKNSQLRSSTFFFFVFFYSIIFGAIVFSLLRQLISLVSSNCSC